MGRINLAKAICLLTFTLFSVTDTVAGPRKSHIEKMRQNKRTLRYKKANLLKEFQKNSAKQFNESQLAKIEFIKESIYIMDDYENISDLIKKGLTIKDIHQIIVAKVDSEKYFSSDEIQRDSMYDALLERQTKRTKQLYINISRMNKRSDSSSEKFKKVLKELQESASTNNDQLHSALVKELHFNMYSYALVRNRVNTILREGFFNIDILGNKNNFKVSSEIQSTDIDYSKNRFYQTKKIEVNPNSKHGSLLLRDIKISLAASLQLLDFYEFALGHYLGNKQLRDAMFLDVPPHSRKINADKIVKDVYMNYMSYLKSEKTANAINLITKAKKLKVSEEKEGSYKKTKEEKELDRMLDNAIITSFTYRYLTGQAPNEKQDFKTASIGKLTRDGFKKWFSNFTYGLSKTFGNFAGSDLFVSRRGKLHDMRSKTPTRYKDLVGKMRSLDMILEKTPFRATDKFIPGHWGHVAIWLGTKEELQEHGLWKQDDYLLTDGRLDRLDSIYRNQIGIKVKGLPDYKENVAKVLDKMIKKNPHLEEIYKEENSLTKYNWFKIMVLNEHYIVEALRPGVQINTMEHFLEIDDLAVLRPHYCEESYNDGKCFNKDERKKYLQNALYQVGKNYDFNFDANTEDLIVCSELAYITYDKKELVWETSKSVIGGQSISPDQVAYRSDEQGDYYYPVHIVYNGDDVQTTDQAELFEIFNGITSSQYDKVQELTGISKDYNTHKIRAELFDSEKDYKKWKNKHQIAN